MQEIVLVTPYTHKTKKSGQIFIYYIYIFHVINLMTHIHEQYWTELRTPKRRHVFIPASCIGNMTKSTRVINEHVEVGLPHVTDIVK